MKFGVIGSGGFIGNRIVESFCLGRGPTPVPIAADPVHHRLDARFAIDRKTADTANQEALAKALAGCGSAVCLELTDAEEPKRRSTAVCRAAAAAGVKKLVFLSNAEPAAVPTPGVSARNANTPSTDSPRGDISTATERHIFAECRRLGISVHALRPGIVYGPRCPLIAQIATELAEQRAWLLGKGEQVFNGTYVDNLVTALRLCLATKAPSGRTFTIGDAERVTWRELYDAIARELELSSSRVRYVASTADVASDGNAEDVRLPADIRPLSVAERGALQQSVDKASLTAAAKLLGYAPGVTFAESIRRTCGWWQFAHGVFERAA